MNVKTVKTNDIKKGARILLSNGWYGTMKDNMRGNTRMAEIEGFCTEMGSIYAYDIVKARNQNTMEWEDVELTKKQQSHMAMVKGCGF